jgi:hypothetical protein
MGQRVVLINGPRINGGITVYIARGSRKKSV